MQGERGKRVEEIYKDMIMMLAKGGHDDLKGIVTEKK